MNTDRTYCMPINPEQEICKDCLRRRGHQDNMDKLKGKIVSLTTFVPKYSEIQGTVCTGEIK